MDPQTRVVMAEGEAKPVAELAVGDRAAGMPSDQIGALRRERTALRGKVERARDTRIALLDKIERCERRLRIVEHDLALFGAAPNVQGLPRTTQPSRSRP